MTRLRIAIIGSGVAGITAAHLLSRCHHVTLFEKNDYVGGHTNTIVIDRGPDAGTAVDTGFIVTNDRTYPNFKRLLADLQVEVRDSDMSFGFQCRQRGLLYASRNLNSLFAQRGNLLRPSFLRMLAEIPRFNRIAKHDLATGFINGATLGEYVRERHFFPGLVDSYLAPMGAAIWSIPQEQILDYPAQSFLRFFENHGLLTIRDQPQWQTIVGASHAYVRSFLSRFPGRVVLRAGVSRVWRRDNGVQIERQGEPIEAFDKVVLATHADEALALLAEPTAEERRLLGSWRYERNLAVLHTDASLLPERQRAWASWNYFRNRSTDQPVSVTYHMNRLQGLKTKFQYCVTLNDSRTIDPAAVIREIEYKHPVYNFASLSSQASLPSLNGVRNSYFCGSYFRYGFHEDAVTSGMAVARHFGVEL